VADGEILARNEFIINYIGEVSTEISLQAPIAGVNDASSVKRFITCCFNCMNIGIIFETFIKIHFQNSYVFVILKCCQVQNCQYAYR